MSASQAFDWLGLSRPEQTVKITTLPASYFKFPPSPDPATVPPPTDHPTLAHPIAIPADLYNALLSAHVPITIALVYMSVVSVLNSVNANRNHKAWAFSRTRVFRLLVITHNVFLALYSAWTFTGMLNALHTCMPGWGGESWKVAETVDALCKMHGPRGIGSAASYNATTSAWTLNNRLYHLTSDGNTPDSTDVGRLWNEGLAFYGWLFYLSKFYEVIDTLIILAKGKKSSLLQTYHHAGAMLSMWAGIRYMSPPIWMFVLVNSGIHAIMYTFYLCSALGIRVPKWFKQTLTTLQITQFVVGATYAFAHLFVAYQIPVSVPYVYRMGEMASKAVSSASTDISSVVPSVIATASAGTGAWLKKAILRGAGYEGLAENVLNEQGKPFGVDAVRIVEDLVAREETRYRDELQWVNCLDTSGQVFAILLNVLYLAPLTWLFAQFFVTSYLKRIERRRSSTASEAAVTARKSLQDASRGVRRRLSEAVEEMHRAAEEIGDDTVVVDGDEVKRELRDTAKKAKASIKQASGKLTQNAPGVDATRVRQEVQRDMEAVRKTLQEAGDKVKVAVDGAASDEQKKAVQAKAQNVKKGTAETVTKAVDNLSAVADAVKQQAGPTADAAVEKATQVKDTAVETAQKVASQAKDVAAGNAKSTKKSAKAGKKKVEEPDANSAETEKEAEPQEQKSEPGSKSPNGNGTGAEEATGRPTQAEEDELHHNGDAAQAKREEDKVIDESQPVRDDAVDQGKNDKKPSRG